MTLESIINEFFLSSLSTSQTIPVTNCDVGVVLNPGAEITSLNWNPFNSINMKSMHCTFYHILGLSVQHYFTVLISCTSIHAMR